MDTSYLELIRRAETGDEAAFIQLCVAAERSAKGSPLWRAIERWAWKHTPDLARRYLTVPLSEAPTLRTIDDDAAITALRDHFGIEATVSEGAVVFHAASGEAFVPRLFAELGVGITAVTVSRPTMDDVFMSVTGSTIRDAETSSPAERNRALARVVAKAGR